MNLNIAMVSHVCNWRRWYVLAAYIWREVIKLQILSQAATLCYIQKRNCMCWLHNISLTLHLASQHHHSTAHTVWTKVKQIDHPGLPQREIATAMHVWIWTCQHMHAWLLSCPGQAAPLYIYGCMQCNENGDHTRSSSREIEDHTRPAQLLWWLFLRDEDSARMAAQDISFFFDYKSKKRRM